MSVVTTTKYISRGMQDVITKKLNSGFTAYTGDIVKWTGDTAFTFTPTRTSTELASGNDPLWMNIQGLVTGDVELTFHDIAISDMEHLLGVKYSAADGLLVGDSDDPVVFIGLSLNRIVRDASGNESYNKVILYKVCFDLPAIDIKTISNEDNAISELKLTGKAYPVFFTKTNGTQGARTYAILNSTLNATKYTANAADIVFPAEMSSGTSQ